MYQEGKTQHDGNFLVFDSAGTISYGEAEDDDADGLNLPEWKELPLHQRQSISPATREAHVEGGVPCLSIHFDKLDEEHIGRFIYLCEIAIAVYVYCLNENPFDQPGC